MEVHLKSSWLFIFGLVLLANSLQAVQGEAETDGPSESECRPYIEKALKELETGDTLEPETEHSIEETIPGTNEDVPTLEGTDDSIQQDGETAEQNEESEQNKEDDATTQESNETKQDNAAEEPTEGEAQEPDEEPTATEQSDEHEDEAKEPTESGEALPLETTEQEVDEPSKETEQSENDDDKTSAEAPENKSLEEDNEAPDTEHSVEKRDADESVETQEPEQLQEDTPDTTADNEDSKSDENKSGEAKSDENKSEESKPNESSAEEIKPEETQSDEAPQDLKSEETTPEEAVPQEPVLEEAVVEEQTIEPPQDEPKSAQEPIPDEPSPTETSNNPAEQSDEPTSSEDEAPEEDLILEIDIPDELRPHDHVAQLLKLDRESSDAERILDSMSEITLKELKKMYENAIKPLEVLYKYRDLSNRHFGDAEIFSKPLILFMGPWSGGKSSIINYLLDNEYNETSLRTGAEPSPAYFNILMYGDEPEVIDGTQLAADHTFSGLQKFGQGLEERLRGLKLPRKLLEKVNIVEIPGILEVRKQVSRVFPFNDACQWFIDRADIIFLVYDPSKLDVGPETEAILDQLKGREHQTRIILNKADQVKPEELMRVQGALIWNISPLMSSPQPPVMYTTSLWSRPYEHWAPVRLLQAQERAFLRDLRTAVDKRIENKIASARRFAVRVRNHAKMVDCYLTTYYNHKSVFGNRKQVADAITEHPQDYHIYEGLSTLTNISRYDLPDPDVYKDFFKLNALYEFQQLSATCTYFRGCPINRLDIAIAYDLPELVGKHKRLVESALHQAASVATPPES